MAKQAGPVLRLHRLRATFDGSTMPKEK